MTAGDSCVGSESDRFTVLLAEFDGETAGYGVLNGPEARIDDAYKPAGLDWDLLSNERIAEIPVLEPFRI